MSDPRNDRERFELDLAFFVNGTLDAESRAWMEARLVENPSWQSDVELERLTRETVRSARSTLAAEERWRSLRERLITEGVLAASPSVSSTPEQAPPRAAPVGWAAALLRPLSLPWPVLGLALAVMATQAWLLAGRGSGSDVGNADALRFRSASAPAASCAGMGWLRVAVSPAMAVGDWAAALRALGLTVAAGPMDGGEWIVRLPDDLDPEAARLALVAVPGVEEVTRWSAAGGACP
jgi:hypothetical protein